MKTKEKSRRNLFPGFPLLHKKVNISRFDTGGFGGGDDYNNGNGSGGNGSGGPGGDRDPKRQNVFLFIIAAIVTLLCVSYFMNAMTSASEKKVSYTQFINWVDADQVKSVEFTSDRINITLNDNVVVEGTGEDLTTKEVQKSDNKTSNEGRVYGSVASGEITYYTAQVQDDTLTQRLLDHDVQIEGEVANSSGLILSFVLTYILPIVLMWVLLSFLFRRMSKGGGMFNVGKSNAKIYGQKETGVTFKDVAGEDEAKESLVEVVDFLHNPGKYSQIGARLPKGALLVGPPGTGKTLLAKAVAGEAGVPFFSLAGSDFIELYVGVGASRVRDLFKEAEKNAPCIIFIDEIDAIGRSRDSKYGGGNEEREQTLNQLLSEMDGFDGKKGIIILAATNRPEILDKALLRPGRFDRRIIVDKPDLKGRVEILKVHAKDVLMDDSVDLNEIALATSGAVGSDLANMINEAAINAVKMGRKCVAQKDLFDAVEQVLVGKEKKDRIMSKEERKIVSYHEVGHALIAALQKNSEPVQKITIVPRTMGALGYVMQVPEEEKFLNTEAELRDMLVGLLGGRAAEEIVFDTVTTGASNDIEKATSIARSMVTQYGMSKKFGLMGLESVESKYLDGRTAMNCSDTTAADIDTEVMKLLKESYKQAKAMLKENRELMDKLAAFLIEKETITGKEFMKIYRKEKGIPEPVEEEKKPEPKQKAEQPSDSSEQQAQGGSSQNPGGQQGNDRQSFNPGGYQPDNRYQAPPSPYQHTSRQEAWEQQYRQNHWSNNQPGNAPQNPQENGNAPQNPYQNMQQNPYQNQQQNPYQNGRFTNWNQQGNAPQNNFSQNGAPQSGIRTGRFSQVPENAIHGQQNADNAQAAGNVPPVAQEVTQAQCREENQKDMKIILEAATKMDAEEKDVAKEKTAEIKADLQEEETAKEAVTDAAEESVTEKAAESSDDRPAEDLEEKE